ASRYPRHLLRRLSGTTQEPSRSVHRSGVHRPAIQLKPQLRSLPGRDEGEARLRGSPRIDAGVHRLHAAALRRTGPRAQEDRIVLLPLSKQLMDVTKAHILNEIKRTADANGGVPLGWRRFSNETGINLDDLYKNSI